MADRELKSTERSTAVRQVSFAQFVRSVQRSTGLRLGSDLKPQQEPIVLKSDANAQFPATEIAQLQIVDQKKELLVSFFGLFGPSGALPQHYTQILIDRIRKKDFALRDFLDMFNHRLLSFFYRSWEKHQFPVAFETARAGGREDTVTEAIRSLVGMRTNGLWGRLSIPSQDLLFFAGHLSNRRMTPVAIRSMIESAFRITATIEQFTPQRMTIPIADQTRLGAQPLGRSLSNQLGVDAVAGSQVWDFQNKFRLRLGPLRFTTFQELSPESSKLRQIVDHVRIAVGPQLDFDVQLVLDRSEVVMAQLGNPSAARLGWNTWLGQWSRVNDADDTIFELPDVA